MFKVALIVAAFIAASSALVRQCDRGVLGPLPVAHRITGCPNLTQRCRIVRGRDIIGELDFVASEFEKLFVVSASKV